MEAFLHDYIWPLAGIVAESVLLLVILLAALSCLALQRPTDTPPAPEHQHAEAEPVGALVGAAVGNR